MNTKNDEAMTVRKLSRREMQSVRGGGVTGIVQDSVVCPLDGTRLTDPNHTTAHMEQVVVCDQGKLDRPIDLYIV